MNNSILLSIIVPMYNAEKFIDKLVDNLSKINNAEIIMIDDGSNDFTYQYVKSKCGNKEQFILRTKSNEGVSATRNMGIDLARGQYVFFVDADDEVNVDTVNYILNRPCTEDIIFAGIVDKIIENETVISISNPYLENSFMNKSEFISNFGCYLNEMILYTPCNKLIRRELIIENNIWYDKKLSLGEDILFNLKVYDKVEKITFIPLVIYSYNHYMNRRDTGSTKYVKNELEIASHVFEEIKNLMHKYDVFDKNRTAFNRFVVRRLAAIFTGIQLKQCDLSIQEKVDFFDRVYSRPIINSAINDKTIKLDRLKDKLMIYLYRLQCKRIIYILYRINTRRKL